MALVVGCAAQPGKQAWRDAAADIDWAAFTARAPQVDGPLALDEALRLAAQHNVEIWIADQERRFQHELATQSLLKLLPSLIGGVDSSRRNRLDASSSISFDSGQESLEPSYSSDQTTQRWDVAATWSLLDFGISFFRARQQGNRVAIAEERARRVRQNIELEVTRAWWQAVTAREAAAQAACVADELTQRLAAIDREMDEQAIGRVEGLQRQAVLLEQQAELRKYQRDYLAAKTQLATLIGLPPATPLRLAPVDLRAAVEPQTFHVDALEWEALRHRPELFEKDLEEALSQDEARVALAQAFPSLSVFWRFDTSDNRFLVFQEWQTVGLRASWDLLAVPQHLQQHLALRLHTDMVQQRRLAVAIAILTQLHLALIDYRDTLDDCGMTAEIAATREHLLRAVESAAEQGKAHAGELLEHRMKYLKAQARYLQAYAQVQVAHARILNTVGRSLTPAAAPTPTTTAPADAAPQIQE